MSLHKHEKLDLAGYMYKLDDRYAYIHVDLLPGYESDRYVELHEQNIFERILLVAGNMMAVDIIHPVGKLPSLVVPQPLVPLVDVQRSDHIRKGYSFRPLDYNHNLYQITF